MLHPDFGEMAAALGTREDRLRITLGIPTRLQKLVRKARTFEEVVGLESRFSEKRSGYRDSCGPVFEPEEKAEYEARRQALFAEYLARFNTVEEFRGFRLPEEDRALFLTREEYDLGSEKLKPLLLSELDAAGTNLEAVLRIRELEEFFSKSNGLRSSELSDVLSMRLRKAFTEALRTASSTAARIALIKAAPFSRDQLFLGSRQDYLEKTQPWRFVWEEAKTLQEGLELEQAKLGSYIDNTQLEKRLKELLEAEMEALSDFDSRLALARTLSKRDWHRADSLYSTALELAADKAEHQDEVGNLISIWEDRRKHSERPSGTWPDLPDAIIAKYDGLYLEKVKEEEDLFVLANYANYSPYATESFRTASKKLEAHFQGRVTSATTLEELRAIEAEANGLSDRIRLVTYERANELTAEAEARTAEGLVAKARSASGEVSKEDLISVYRRYAKAKDEAKAREVLLLLAPHFPLEHMPDALPAVQ
jgi:hypothetical protein